MVNSTVLSIVRHSYQSLFAGGVIGDPLALLNATSYHLIHTSRRWGGGWFKLFHIRRKTENKNQKTERESVKSIGRTLYYNGTFRLYGTIELIFSLPAPDTPLHDVRQTTSLRSGHRMVHQHPVTIQDTFNSYAYTYTAYDWNSPSIETLEREDRLL